MSAFDPKRTSTLWVRRYGLVREPRSLRHWTKSRRGFAHQWLASQRACLLPIDLISNEVG